MPEADGHDSVEDWFVSAAIDLLLSSVNDLVQIDQDLTTN